MTTQGTDYMSFSQCICVTLNKTAPHKYGNNCQTSVGKKEIMKTNHNMKFSMSFLGMDSITDLTLTTNGVTPVSSDPTRGQVNDFVCTMFNKGSTESVIAAMCDLIGDSGH